MLHPSLPSQTGIRSTIAGLAAACILCGCSSRIYTTLSEAGAPLPADSVRLFTEDLPRPASSRKIGELTISSSSENADERNREAVDLAVRATAGIGGDALSVTEQNETATSNGTTYTLSADLLRIDGRDTSATMRFDPPLQLRSKHPDKVIRRMNDRQRNRLPVTCSTAVPERGSSLAISTRSTERPMTGAPPASPTTQATTIVSPAVSRSDSATPAFA